MLSTLRPGSICTSGDTVFDKQFSTECEHQGHDRNGNRTTNCIRSVGQYDPVLIAYLLIHGVISDSKTGYQSKFSVRRNGFACKSWKQQDQRIIVQKSISADDLSQVNIVPTQLCFLV